MDIIVEISDSIASGLKRKAKLKEFAWVLEQGDLHFKIKVEMLRYKNIAGAYGDLIEASPEYPAYSQEFIANNTVRLDENGDIISLTDMSIGVGEYDATMYKISQLYPEYSPIDVVVSLIQEAITKADQRGRFN